MTSDFAYAHPNGIPRIFDSFRRWPVVPSSQLLQLRSALLQCMELSGLKTRRELSDSAERLLRMVTEELERRGRLRDDAGPGHIRPVSRNWRSAGPSRHHHP